MFQVRQREEEARCSKMMLKFREDKIQRLESLVGDLKPVDAYLLEENVKLSEENKLLRAKVDRNPEVTRFAVENIRLLEQLRRFFLPLEKIGILSHRFCILIGTFFGESVDFKIFMRKGKEICYCKKYPSFGPRFVHLHISSFHFCFSPMSNY